MSGRYECGVCWYAYEPSVGDDVWQVPPGTPFEELPAHWRCPRCDGERERFLAVSPPAEEVDPAGEVVVAYQRVAERMRGLPVFNERLVVESTRFQRLEAKPFGSSWLGVVVTPWFMNAVLVPAEPASRERIAIGTRYPVALPAGEFEFLGAAPEELSPLLTCSLFSPMGQFLDAAAAREVAEAALKELVQAPQPQAPAVAAPSRRGFLRGQWQR